MVHLQKTQRIVDGLKSDKWSAYVDYKAIYILDHPSIFSLNGVSFKDDNITRLHFDGKPGMKLESVNGIKRWPSQLQELWITNMQNFKLSSLSQMPHSVKSLTLMNVIFDSSLCNESTSIDLSMNLKSLSITHCKLSHEALSALNIASLDYLNDLDLAYLDHTELMQYSDKCPIAFPSASLKHLRIDYRLIENIMTHQRPQKMQKLGYVLVKTNNVGGHIDKQQIIQMIRVYFDASNLDITI